MISEIDKIETVINNLYSINIIGQEQHIVEEVVDNSKIIFICESVSNLATGNRIRFNDLSTTYSSYNETYYIETIDIGNKKVLCSTVSGININYDASVVFPVTAYLCNTYIGADALNDDSKDKGRNIFPCVLISPNESELVALSNGKSKVSSVNMLVQYVDSIYKKESDTYGLKYKTKNTMSETNDNILAILNNLNIYENDTNIEIIALLVNNMECYSSGIIIKIN